MSSPPALWRRYYTVDSPKTPVARFLPVAAARSTTRNRCSKRRSSRLRSSAAWKLRSLVHLSACKATPSRSRIWAALSWFLLFTPGNQLWPRLRAFDFTGYRSSQPSCCVLTGPSKFSGRYRNERRPRFGPPQADHVRSLEQRERFESLNWLPSIRASFRPELRP